MGMMGGGQMTGWMVLGGLLPLLLVAAIVFVLVAAGRWLWDQNGPPSGAGASTNR